MRHSWVAASVAVLAACSGSAAAPPDQRADVIAAPATSGAPAQTLAASTVDWPTYHGNRARTGVARSMPLAKGTPRVVATIGLDAAVYASPIVVSGVTIVATENNSVYGFSAAGKQLWRVNLGKPARSAQLPCGNIDPLGITGTPVYDATSHSVYLVAEHANPVRHELVALDPTSGHVNWRTSVDLPGVEIKAMQERGALTIDNAGTVWIPFGGLAGDCGGYRGRVVGVATTGAHKARAYTVPTTREAGIWTPPGPSVDAAGDLFVSVGNGESGSGGTYDFSDSVLRLTGTKLADSFSPSTWATDNDADKDLGSQGPALVGKSWVFIAGKSGTAYVLRQDRLGGIGGEVSQAEVCHSFGGTAVVGDVVYVPCTDGLRAVRIDSRGTMHVLWHAAPSGSPVVGGGRVWALDPSAGVLHALDPRTGREMAQAPTGVTTRFATPAIAGARLFVPTTTGLTVIASS